jgi:DNA modification methylase
MHFVDQIICGDAREVLSRLPEASVQCAITSPPYWDMADYGDPGQIGHSPYEKYITDLLDVWRETERVLAPNGKLCINTPIMPIPKAQNSQRHTRHLKNINSDIEQAIIEHTDLDRFSLYVWQKQTTEKMFGSYPYPPNLYEQNTVEFINVFVKDGKPRKLPAEAKEPSKLTVEEWMELTKQVWALYPEDVQRAKGHPAPFPIALPARLIRLYTFAAAPEWGFEGDIVLDMFNGTGTTTAAAKLLGRRYIGIDVSEEFCAQARRRLESETEAPDIWTMDSKFRRPA